MGFRDGNKGTNDAARDPSKLLLDTWSAIYSFGIDDDERGGGGAR